MSPEYEYNDHIGGNEQILMNDGNLIKNMKDKECNDDINYEDFEEQKIHENFEEIEKLYEEALLKNDDKKRNYNDVYEEKIDENDTEKIKKSLDKEYLLKNDYDNNGKSCIELDFEDINKGTIYGNNEKNIEQLDEYLFNIINKR